MHKFIFFVQFLRTRYNIGHLVIQSSLMPRSRYSKLFSLIHSFMHQMASNATEIVLAGLGFTFLLISSLKVSVMVAIIAALHM